MRGTPAVRRGLVGPCSSSLLGENFAVGAHNAVHNGAHRPMSFQLSIQRTAQLGGYRTEGVVRTAYDYQEAKRWVTAAGSEPHAVSRLGRPHAAQEPVR